MTTTSPSRPDGGPDSERQIGRLEVEMQAAPRLRSRLAWALRRLADRVDRRQSIGISVFGISAVKRADISQSFKDAMEYWGERLSARVAARLAEDKE